MKKQSQPPGAMIRTLRDMAGLTLKQVASGADTSISYLSKVETGTFVPTVGYVARVVAFISTSMLESENLDRSFKFKSDHEHKAAA